MAVQPTIHDPLERAKPTAAGHAARPSDRQALRVTVVGAGYVGAVSAVVLAHLGHRVTCVERDAPRLERWRDGEDPLKEPGLAELLKEVRIRFVGDASDIPFADVIVVAVGTPMGDDGRPDLSQVDDAAIQIGSLAREGAVVLMRSTVPVGTCDRLQNGPLRHQRVVSNPEFLREGRAVHDALFPDRIVVGGPQEARDLVERLYGRIIKGEDLFGGDGTTPRVVPVVWMSPRSAELAALLIQSGLRVSAYDPAVRTLPGDLGVMVHAAVVEACAGADAVVVATEWPEFADMDLAALRAVTRGDLLFDGRDLISPNRAVAAGFRYQGLASLGE